MCPAPQGPGLSAPPPDIVKLFLLPCPAVCAESFSVRRTRAGKVGETGPAQHPQLGPLASHLFATAFVGLPCHQQGGVDPPSVTGRVWADPSEIGSGKSAGSGGAVGACQKFYGHRHRAAWRGSSSHEGEPARPVWRSPGATQTGGFSSSSRGPFEGASPMCHLNPHQEPEGAQRRATPGAPMHTPIHPAAQAMTRVTNGLPQPGRVLTA